MPMRILLVGNYAGDRQQSMQRFASLLQSGLRARRIEVDLAAPAELLARFGRPRSDLAKWLGHLDKFVLFPAQLRQRSRGFDLVHVCDQGNAAYLPWLGEQRHLVTCHDCLALRAARGDFAETRTRWSGRRAQQLILAGLRRARHVACVSEATRNDLLDLLRPPRPEVSVIPNALSRSFRPMPAAVAAGELRRIGLDASPPYFLHVGGDYWYKNRRGVIELFARLGARPPFARMQLLLVGEPLTREHLELVAARGLAGRVTACGPISDDALRALYSRAEALLFPSLHEGFGWPILEAQACGCPVITSRREPLASVAGAGAVLIDPQDPGAAAAVVTAAWPQRAALIAQGYANARRYDVERFIAAYVALYERICA